MNKTVPAVSDEMVEAACKAVVLGEDQRGRDVHLSPTEARAAISAALAAQGQEPVAVEEIECVSWENGYEEPAAPIFRVEIDGYCADFETKTAAENFAGQ